VRCLSCLSFFFFLATSKRVRQANRGEFVPTYSSEGRGYSCGNGCLIFCGALPVVLVVFFFFLQHRSGCARQTGENLSRRTVHREVQNENEEPKSAPRQQKENTTLPTSMLEFHSTVVYSNSVDPFRSLLAPQAWALYHKSNTTSIVPVPALMRDWPALNSAVLALFAIVPGARFSAGERSVHVPALKGSLDCKVYEGDTHGTANI